MPQLKDSLAIKINSHLSGYPDYFTTSERVGISNTIATEAQEVRIRIRRIDDIKENIRRSINQTIDWQLHGISIQDKTNIENLVSDIIIEDFRMNY